MNASKTKTREAKTSSPLLYSLSQAFLFISASLDCFSSAVIKENIQKMRNMWMRKYKNSLHEKGNFNAGTPCLDITDREPVSSFHWNNTSLLWLGRKQQWKAQFCKGWIFLEEFTLPPDLSLVFQLENHFCKLNFSLCCSSAHCNSAFPTAAATSFCVFSCNPNFTLTLVTHFATCQSSFSDFIIPLFHKEIFISIKLIATSALPSSSPSPLVTPSSLAPLIIKIKKKKRRNKQEWIIGVQKKWSTCCTHPGKITACEIWKPFMELSKAMD